VYACAATSVTEKSIKENIEDLNKNKANIDDKLAQNVIKNTEKLLIKFQKELRTIHETVIQSLVERREMCKLKRKMVRNSRDMLQKATQNASDSQIFLQMKRTQLKQKEIEDFVLNELSDVMRKTIEHEFEDLMSLMATITRFGYVSIVEGKPPKLPEPSPDVVTTTYRHRDIVEITRWVCSYNSDNTIEMGMFLKPRSQRCDFEPREE